MSVRSFQIGSQRVTLEIPSEKIISSRPNRQSTAVTDLSTTVADALELPVGFPALRGALTPDDHLVILVQEEMNGLAPALQALLHHIRSANVKLENVTLLVPPREPGTHTGWLNELPSDLQGCPVEVHQPEASRLAYLASNKSGRRIYLNRTLVDADQVIILGPVRFNPFFGVASGLADLFPAFSNQETRQELLHDPHLHMSDAKKPPAIWEEAQTVGWLLGIPFVISVLEGSGNEVSAIWAGSDSPVHHLAETRLREELQFIVPRQVDLVIGTISSTPDRQSFNQVAVAALQATRITGNNGAVAILSEARPELPRGAEIMQIAPDPASGLSQVRQDPATNSLCWWQLTTALEQSKIYLHSRIPAQALEDLWIVPIDDPAQVQNLIRQAHTIVVVEDLHRSLPILGRG